MRSPVRIGFLGGGMMTQIGHLPAYLTDKRCAVVAVAEQRPSLVEALGARLGADRLMTDHRALLARQDIDAVVISAPRAATGPLTLAALEAGKHVMAEKPMAHTCDQARRLVDAAARRKLVYAVGFMKRYDPGVRAAKALFDEVVASGRLGRLLLARFYDYSRSYAWPVPPHVRPKESRAERFATWAVTPEWLPPHHAGAYQWFLNSASHDVNLVQLFFPGPLEVEAARASGDSAVAATLSAGPVTIVLEIAKTEAGRWLEGAELLFEKGRIGLSIPSPMATEAVAEVVLDDLPAGRRAERIATGAGWCFAEQARGFLDALTGVAPPATSGADGLAEMQLTEAIWRRMES